MGATSRFIMLHQAVCSFLGVAASQWDDHVSKSGSEPVHGRVHLVAQPVGQETPRVRRAIASKSMRPVVLPLLSRVSTGLTAEQARGVW